MMPEKEFKPPLVDDSIEYECTDGQAYHEGKGYYDARVCNDHACKAVVGAPHKRGCRRYIAAWMEHIIPHTDLRSITRGAETARTTIEIIDRYDNAARHLWITCGQVSLRQDDRRPGDVTITCYLTEGVTDFEHDSAYAFHLDLIGWVFRGVDYGAVSFYGWLPSDIGWPGEFRVPGPGYNPMEDSDVYLCNEDYCAKDPHPMVSEGKFIAPPNPELHKLVKGKRVRVTMRPVYDYEMEEEKAKAKPKPKKKKAKRRKKKAS